MIGIQLDGQQDFLETKEDTSVEIQLNNPILGDADVLSPGSFSLPFALPGGDSSPKNATALKHPEVIENNLSYQIQKASLFVNGVPFKKGTLKATNNSTDSKPDEINVNFFFGMNTLDPNLKTARLRNVMDENIVIDASDIQRVIYIKKLVDAGWDITVNGINYQHSNINAVANAINADSLAAANKDIYVATAVVEGVAASPGGLAAPYIILKSKKITFFHDPILGDIYGGSFSQDPLVELSATVSEDKIADYEFEAFDMTDYFNAFKTFLASYIDGDFPSNKYRFPVMFNQNIYNGINNITKESEIINAVDADGLIINDWINIKNYNTLQPCILLKYVLDQIANAFGFTWEGDFYDDPLTTNRMIDTAMTLDVPMDFIGATQFVFWKRSFNISDLVPDISVVDFLKGIASRYNLGVYFNEVTNKVRICFRENIAKANGFDDITKYSSPPTAIDEMRVTGFTLICHKDETDLFSIDESIDIGTPQDEIPITCGRLFQETYTIYNAGIMQGPRVNRKNNDAKFTLRIFHFKGMVNNGAFSYQAASINPPDGFFTESLTDLLLAKGIANTYYKYWLLFKKNWRQVTLNVNWPLRALRTFDWQLKRRFDRSNYIVSQMTVKVTNNGVQPTQILLLTMK